MKCSATKQSAAQKRQTKHARREWDINITKACKRAGIANFHWHDLRHTAITRLARKLPNVIELAVVSGHRSLTMLKRYYHPSAADLARKLG